MKNYCRAACIDLIDGKLELHLQLHSPFIASKWKKKVALGHGTYSAHLWTGAQNQELPPHWAALGESQNSGPALHLALYVVVTFCVVETQGYVVGSFSDVSINTGPFSISTLIYLKTSHIWGSWWFSFVRLLQSSGHITYLPVVGMMGTENLRCHPVLHLCPEVQKSLGDRNISA